MIDNPTATAARCGYGCGYRAVFAVATDSSDGVHYTCSRHLAHYVRSLQSQEPYNWLKVCELTDE